MKIQVMIDIRPYQLIHLMRKARREDISINELLDSCARRGAYQAFQREVSEFGRIDESIINDMKCE